MKEQIKKIWRKETKIALVVIIALLLWHFVSLTAAFFWGVFLVFIFFNYESTIVAQTALICLVCLPLLLAVGKEAVAEQMAVYAFYLLTMTVALQIIELKRNPEEEAPKKNIADMLVPLVTAPIVVVPKTVRKVRKVMHDIVPKKKKVVKKEEPVKKPREITRKTATKVVRKSIRDIKKGDDRVL